MIGLLTRVLFTDTTMSMALDGAFLEPSEYPLSFGMSVDFGDSLSTVFYDWNFSLNWQFFDKIKASNTQLGLLRLLDSVAR